MKKKRRTPIRHHKKTSSKGFLNRNSLLAAVIIIGVISLGMGVLIINLQKNSSLNIPSLPTPTVLVPTATPTIIPTPIRSGPTAIPTVVYVPLVTVAPSPTKSPYKYSILKRPDYDLHLTLPRNGGAQLQALLLDENGNVVTDQLGFNYNWSVDDPSIVDYNGPYGFCGDGIKTPCPNDRFVVNAKKVGSTTIHVEVNNGPVLANASFTVVVEEKK